ncbi:MAG: hypothetical protein A2170_10470 [Deltaproteobacteria bacterium RBG_13_53_10]|nr:MAG: hypothetical protein A2170_10470 [Deltaproteobacteria bacterium RBG_13_53_10]
MSAPKSEMRKTLHSLPLLILILLLPLSSLAQPPLKVGALVPFSGRWGDSGRECAKGMLDAARWLNQRGGLHGTKVDVLVIDDVSQPAETIAAFRRLNETDQALVLYVYSAETGAALLPHIHYHRLPTFLRSLPSHLSDAAKYPYLFAVLPNPIDLSKIGLKFLSQNSGVKGRKPRILFMGSSDQLGRDFLREAREHSISMGFDVGEEIWMDLGTQIPSAQFSGVNRFNPDFVYLSAPSKEAATVLQEMRGTDSRATWLCNDKAFDENLHPFDGVLGVQPVSPFGEDVPGMAVVKEGHQRWHPYDSHTLSYVEGWASIQVISEALDRSLPAQGFSRERVKAALEGFKDSVFGGLIPPVTFTSKDHRPSVESRIFMIKDMKIVRHTGFISAER